MEESDVVDLSGKHLSSKTLLKELEEKLKTDVSRLDLTQNHVDQEVADFLSKFLMNSDICSLISLALIETRLTIQAATTIFKAIGSSSLLEFYADDNVLKVESLTALGESLSKSSIQVLSLVGCDISDDGFSALIANLNKCDLLRYLRVESNSIHETGLRSLTNILGSSSLISIEIADNMIWQQGMTEFLIAAKNYGRLEYLDISYNCVNLKDLINFLTDNDVLKKLAVSGCKVDKAYVRHFISSLKKTKLNTLLMCGFDYDKIPVKWQKVKDDIFSDPDNFSAFKEVIKFSEYLEDIRIGFLDLDQISDLADSLNIQSIQRNIKISLQDFGRSGDCWVLNFPAFSLDAPCDVVEWESKLDTSNSKYFGTIVKNALFRDKIIQKVDLANTMLEDEQVALILESLDGHVLQLLDLTSNKLSHAMYDYLLKHLERNTILELCLTNNKSNLFNVEKLFQFFYLNPDKCPRLLEVGFTVPGDSEDIPHSSLQPLFSILENNYKLKSLLIKGSVSVKDAIRIAESLVSNNTLTHLKIESQYLEQYQGAEKFYNNTYKDYYLDAARKFQTALKSGCALQSFKYDSLVNVYSKEAEINEILLDCFKMMNDKGKFE